MAHLDGRVDEADNGDFSVEVRRRALVTAESPPPEPWLSLSNLDLLLPPLYPSFFFVYEKPSDVHLELWSMVSSLKKGLSKVLLPYYPLAGEVIISPAGEPEIHCNNHGVEFIEAYADIDLCSLDLHHPDASVAGKLVPRKATAVLSLQVTELKCGALVLSCILDHRISDGYSTKMFLEAWAEMTTSGTISMIPSFQRFLLSPRSRPARPDKSVNDLYMPVPLRLHSTPRGYISRIYYMKAESMASFQVLASSHDTKRTKLEAFSGCLWRAMAKSASDEESCTMAVVVDGRMRLIDDVRSMDTMARYYGNILSLPYGELDANVLTSKPLSWVADQVHDFLRPRITKDHFLGLVDLVQAHKPHPVMPTLIYKGTKEGPSVAMSSGRFFQTGKLDFGWGRPILGSCYFPWGLDSGYVMPMPTPSGKGDWVVYMHLFRHQLDVVEDELGDVLHPLNLAHLKVHDQ